MTMNIESTDNVNTNQSASSLQSSLPISSSTLNYPSNLSTTSTSTSSSSSASPSSSTNGEALKSKEILEEKKRKLTLPLNNNMDSSSSNPSSGNSMSSNESSNVQLSSMNSNASKRFKSLYNQDCPLYNKKAAETPLNKDLLAHLDKNNNLSTPQLERLMADFNSNPSSLLKTPGSALAILTPNTSNIFINNVQHTLNMHNSSQAQTSLTTPNITLTAAIDGSNNYLPNYILNTPSSSFMLQNDSYYQSEKSGLTPISSLINPINIFPGLMNVENSFSQVQKQENDNNNNINEMNKFTNLATTSSNTGNFYILQPINTDLNSNKVNEDLTNLNNPSTLKAGKKDELQTVPVHSMNGNIITKQGGKKRNAKIKKTLSTTSPEANSDTQNTSIYENCMKLEPSVVLNSNNQNMSPASIVERRNTDKSTASSTTNGDDQEVLKLEKKRERNREAARKCRTRKLEKIAELELKVKNLTESNEFQKSKNRALIDEISAIKIKLESHQKSHNCDLKVDNVNLF